MITEFVQAFNTNRAALREGMRTSPPESYADIVRRVVVVLSGSDDYGAPDPERITAIDHGDYQGTHVFVIGAQGYQPSDHWYVRVSYGSCSACDTFQNIQSQAYDDAPTDAQLDAYMVLALHIVQRMKPMDDVEDPST